MCVDCMGLHVRILQNGFTPLHCAAMGGHTTCVEHLLSTPGIDVNIKNKVNTSNEYYLRNVFMYMYMFMYYVHYTHYHVYDGASCTLCKKKIPPASTCIYMYMYTCRWLPCTPC